MTWRKTLLERLAVGLVIAAIPAVTLGIGPGQQAEPEESARPPAQIAVSPGKFEVQLGSRPVVESLKLINFAERPVEIRVSVASWDLDDSNSVRILEPTEDSLDRAIVVNPRSFIVPARGEQTVRFSIRPRTEPAPGEHRAMLYFEEVPGKTDKAVQVRFKLGVAVYAYAGEVERRGELHGLRVAADADVLGAVFDVASRGNAHVRLNGQYGVWPVDRFPGISAVTRLDGMSEPGFTPPQPMLLAGFLPNIPVLAGTRRPIVHAGAHQLSPGRYVFAATGSLGEREIREAVEFTVPPAASARVAGEQQ